MPDTNHRRSEILGMPFGTACNRLRRMVMFDILRRHEENICFRCGRVIDKFEDLTLEHKVAWQGGGPTLFWDLNNIAFSHRHCNVPTGVVRREIINGTLWCSHCQQYKAIPFFHRDKKQRTGYALICKDCSNSKRKEVKATGDCTKCGAVRGTRAFRRSHNICMTCNNNLVRARYIKHRQREKRAESL
jgi:hypothetical protein